MMHIRKVLFFPVIKLLILSAGIYSCSPRLQLVSSWQEASPGFDDPSSWPQLAERDEKSLMYLQLSNDSEHLYVMLQTDDDMTKMKMLRAGMELLIDTLGTLRGHCSLVFPIRQETIFSGGIPMQERGGGLPGGESGDRTYRGSGPGGAPGGGRPDRTEMYRRLISQQTHAMIHGFKDHRDGRTSIDGEKGIRVSLDLDSVGMLSYRAIIPLYAFYKELTVAADTNKEFGMVVRVNGIDMPQRPSGGMPTGGSMSPGRARPGTPTTGPGGMPGQGGMGGGSRGGMNRPGGADMQNMSKDQVLKARFSLQYL